MTDSNASRPRSPFGVARLAALGAAVAVGMTASWLVLAPAAFASDGLAPAPLQQMRMHFGHGDAAQREAMHAHAHQVLVDAGATEAQQRQIKALVDRALLDQHADVEAYHASLHDLKALLTASTLDARAIAAARAEQDELLLATNRRFVETATAIAQVLTPAQRQRVGAQFDKMLAAHLGHHSR